MDQAHLRILPEAHLINILKQTREAHPNFVLFLGAGASVTSLVKSSATMIAEWRQQYYDHHSDGASRDKFFSQISWHGTDLEYSSLFQELYDQPSQRREYIEACIGDATPSWGYIYLVNLIRLGVFKTIFTTNFDDLLNEACYLFSRDVRPLVCAHDSSIKGVRMTSRRPKIIKLHGDFLFDNIKNTVRELESLEINMREKFKQYATEFGLIVLGYAGNDRSVMDTIEALLKSEENFPSGIYWCVRKNSVVHPNVRGLARFPKFKLIEVKGFDEFCAQVHEKLELELQREMRDPYGVLAARLNALIEAVNLPDDSPAHPVIDRDIENLGRQVAKNLEVEVARMIDPKTEEFIPVTVSTGTEVVEIPIPFEFLAEAERRKGNFDRAFPLIMRQLAIWPHARAFAVAFHILSESGWKRGQTEMLMKLLLESASIVRKRPEMTFDISLMLMTAGKWDHAMAVVEFGMECHRSDVLGSSFEKDYYLINKAQIPLHQRQSLDEPTIEEMNRIAREGNIVSKMGANIVLGNYAAAEVILGDLLEDGSQGWPSRQEVWKWPVVALLKPHMKDSALKDRLDAGATKSGWVEYGEGIIGF